MAVRADYSDASKSSLLRSHEAFSSGNSQTGFTEFRSVPQMYQNKVYEQIWINRDRPQGNSEYGRQVFHDTDKLFSTAQEKATAIVPLIRQELELQDQERQLQLTGGRRAVYKNVWNEYRRQYDQVFSHYEEIYDPRKFGEAIEPLIPAHIAPTTAVALISVSYVAYAVITIIAAFKGA